MINLPTNLQEIYDECKSYQYIEKPSFSKLLSIDKVQSMGKGNGTKPRKASDEEEVKEKVSDNRRCYNCGQEGHIATNCPNGRRGIENQNRGVSQSPQTVYPMMYCMPQMMMHHFMVIGHKVMFGKLTLIDQQSTIHQNQ